MLNPGEFLGTGPDKHDVARFLHNPPGCSDRVFNDGDTTNGTGHPRLAIHDGCVEFCLPVLIQYGSFTRIEQREILHKTDHGLNGIQTAALTGAIIMAGDATVPNVLYGCRGIWSVLLVLLLGGWLGLGENHDRRVIYRRLAGAAIIAAAIACTVLGGRLRGC